MKLLIAGIVMSVVAWVWLFCAEMMGESPLHYNPRNPWFFAGNNLNFVLHQAYAPIAHAMLGAGIAVFALRGKQPAKPSPEPRRYPAALEQAIDSLSKPATAAVSSGDD